MHASLSVHDLHLTWPDGSTVFDGLDLTIGPGRHGLVGLNGSGKSTLLRLITGELRPQSGSVTVDGSIAHLHQDPGYDESRTVADVAGISDILAALSRIEAGSTSPDDFDAVGDDWDVAARAGVELSRLGLGHLELDRPVGSVSGGELVLLSLAACLLAAPSVLLLDEPTNNLDGVARERLIDAVSARSGTLLVASHDRELLAVMDDIGDLREGRVRWYGGTFDDYEEAIAVEQEAAERAVRHAESDLRTQRRELIESQTVLARRMRYGQRMADQKREPKIVMGARKRAAQVSAAKLRRTHEDRLGAAGHRLSQAEDLVHDDREIRIDLPTTAVPPGRTVLRIRDLRPAFGNLNVDLEVRGPERIGLTGRNGVGKTSLLRAMTGDLAPRTGEALCFVPARLLPQRMDLLDVSLSIADNVARIAPSATDNERRAQLARFLFRGRAADQPAATLSGGERLRATLACLLLAEPAPQLLLLDEPTNNLDLPSVAHLVEALRSYRGALIIVSHDERFLDDLELTRRIEVSAPRHTDGMSKNWAGNLTYHASALHEPTTVDELAEIVAGAARVRGLGSRHSFNAIADTTGLQVSVAALPRDIHIDATAVTVTVPAGAKYGELVEELDRAGWALHNLASLPHISVAGAIATGTHGSGDGNVSLSGAVAGLELVTADGSLLTADRTHPDFAGMVVSLGLLGIVTRVTLDIQPTFEVRQDVYEGLSWSALADNFDAITASAYSVSLFTRWDDAAIGYAWLKSRVDDPRDAPRPDGLFGARPASRAHHPVPDLSAENATQQLGVPGPWWDRLPHFRLGFTPSKGDELQSEFLVPRTHALEAIEAVRRLGPQMAPHLYVAELRTVAADDLWLSPSHSVDCLAMHFTWHQDEVEVAAILRGLDTALAPFDARPHWGKVFEAGPERLAAAYPRLPDLRRLAERLDPSGKLRNGLTDGWVFG